MNTKVWLTLLGRWRLFYILINVLYIHTEREQKRETRARRVMNLWLYMLRYWVWHRKALHMSTAMQCHRFAAVCASQPNSHTPILTLCSVLFWIKTNRVAAHFTRTATTLAVTKQSNDNTLATSFKIYGLDRSNRNCHCYCFYCSLLFCDSGIKWANKGKKTKRANSLNQSSFNNEPGRKTTKSITSNEISTLIHHCKDTNNKCCTKKW